MSSSSSHGGGPSGDGSGGAVILAVDPANNPQAGSGRPLPKKEADIFKNLVKHYEMKQYKKAIKQADSILKRFPNHGETLAMKGLTLNYMSGGGSASSASLLSEASKAKRDEAHQLVKEGLRNDLRSHVCWHVLGLLHRSDRNYNEAIKAYKQALRIDAENHQILRDLSYLQIQMRDLHGFTVSRNTLLTLKPNFKINWMAFALARHLTGDLHGAIKVIDTYLSTLTEGSSELGRCFESSELALYRNSILEELAPTEQDNYKPALDHLGIIEGLVVDRGAWFMKRAELQIKIKDFAAAIHSVLLMFRRGMTENYMSHSLYMMAILQITDANIIADAMKLRGANMLATMIPLNENQKQLVREAYTKQLQLAFPTSPAVQRIPFALLSGDELRLALDGRCRRDLAKGVPSLCAELYSFVLVENKKTGRYFKPTDPVDIKAHLVFQMIVKMADGYVASLEQHSKLAPEDEEKQGSETILWAWFLRASLHELVGENQEGIVLLDKCLDHTPNAVDVYELKARLLKASGDIMAAVECLDKGRNLDKQDRYINNQTTKYMLQAGMEEEALKCIALFTRHEGNPEQNLYDMQCSWYELELAACLARKEEWGRSLKKYAAVVKHFDDFAEDQFDFHAYCLRKVTLRSYVSVIRFEDEVFGQDYYCQAAAGIIRIYLHLYDCPEQNETEEPDYSQMTAAERKKAKAIARKKKKAVEKKEAEATERRAANAAAVVDNGGGGGGKKKQNPKGGAGGGAGGGGGGGGGAGGGGKLGPVDIDPLGKELLKLDPLDEAKKYSAMLARYAPNRLETWILRYDVAKRRKKPLMSLQALHRARAIDPDSTELFIRTVDFAARQRTSILDDGISDMIRTVIEEETLALLGEDNGEQQQQSVENFIKTAAARIGDDPLTELPFRIAVAKALVDEKIGSVSEACALITSAGMSCRKATVDACCAALQALESLGDEASGTTREWAITVKEHFPLAKSSALQKYAVAC